ncbi:oligosaccharide flippase family protein [Caldifermentibacillus hisashii]|uniref:lipopolysaccharide biosynthesis protein n=1 Tax=Caldifermentibacillus hisashii TaxID=996558 RepID=UPI0030D67615
MGIFQLGSSFWQYSARALNRKKVYSLSIIVEAIVFISLNILLISVLDYGLMAIFIAYIAGKLALIVMIESDVKLISEGRKSDFDKTLLRTIIRYSFPLCINTISWCLIGSSNSLIVSYKLGVEQTGIYSLANRFGALMTLFTTVVNMAWLEESFRVHGQKGSEEYFNRVLEVLVRLILSGVAILIPLTYIFFYQVFVFGEYKSGVIFTPIIYLNAALSAIVMYLGSGFLARKESNLIFRTTLIGGIISVTLAFLVTNIYGLIGVVTASLIGTISMFII